MSQTDSIAQMIGAQATKSSPLKGSIRAPGDKSISHRAIIFGAMAEGETVITGLLEGGDILSTVSAMRALGARIVHYNDGAWHVSGVGPDGFSPPTQDVDCGNAGTGVRLIMGAAAGYKLTATFTGDASLSGRPMARVLNPLREMGATAYGTNHNLGDDRLPVTITSTGELNPIDYAPPQASAQVKSAVLLAGLNTKGTTTVREATLSRDHTENMLRAFGVDVTSTPEGAGQVVSVTGPCRLTAADIDVPGDPSSAAFPIVAALITPGSDITVENVMMNPTRTGLFETLVEMGANLETLNMRRSGGEVIADIRVKHSSLKGVTVPPSRAPSMIDEYPILTVAAAYAEGDTVMGGIGEMRVKESDRIAATCALLKNNGVRVDEYEDGMTVTGGPNKNNKVKGGGHTLTHHDHRIAMSALILGLNASKPSTVDDASMIATSFPSFFDQMAKIGAKITMAV